MLKELLNTTNTKPHPVVDFDWRSGNFHRFDLSKDNRDLDHIDLNNEQSFSGYINQVLYDHNKKIGIGGYGEERSLYSRSELFEAEEPRTIHLGIDIWAPAKTPVYAPIDGVIHSFDNRAYHGDYGPVIILEHQLAAKTLYSLYGHLSVDSLTGKKVGDEIKGGQQLAGLGAYHENFHWPPHLHFQLMWDMEGHVGDYPGVCKKSEKRAYLANCPNPEAFVVV